MTVQRFETELGSEGEGSLFIQVPLDVPEVFGAKRVPVRGALNGTAFRSTIAVYGGRYYIPVNRKLRDAAQVAAGQRVIVELERDHAPREVEVPADLAEALDVDESARTSFDGLSYSHRREYVEWIQETKRQETRRRRVEKTVSMLRDGKR